MQKKSWKFGTREVVYSAIGAALYAVLSCQPKVEMSPFYQSRDVPYLETTGVMRHGWLGAGL
jgi:uncharacterized membrane protein